MKNKLVLEQNVGEKTSYTILASKSQLISTLQRSCTGPQLSVKSGLRGASLVCLSQ